MSRSAPCAENTDGVMLTKMKLEKYIHKLDCVGLDGGYTQHLNKLIENSDLNLGNFCHPIRKAKGINFTNDELKFNKLFGSYRSRIESIFGELGCTFQRFNNQAVIRTCDGESFNLQLKLGSLLLNIKKFTDLGKIQTQAHHLHWTQSEFDYCDNNTEIIIESPSLKDQMQHANDILSCQKQLLDLDMAEDQTMEEDNIYEVDVILEHRKKGRQTEYLVKWKGYPDTTWETLDKFNDTGCIDDYWEKVNNV
jgi:hypothetical protein